MIEKRRRAEFAGPAAPVARWPLPISIRRDSFLYTEKHRCWYKAGRAWKSAHAQACAFSCSDGAWDQRRQSLRRI